MKPKIIYVSGPYSALTREARWNNVLKAVKVGIEIRGKGHYPVIPHLYDDFDEVAKLMGYDFDWQSYIDMDLAILGRCDALYFIGESKGACIELERAKEMGLKIFCSLKEVPRLKTLEEWATERGIKILDPDGFDRADIKLWARLFTKEEFDKGIWQCTIETKVPEYEVGE